jgi:two-component system, NarL family, nitrate/nitrite response regulator NarL
MEPIRVLLVDDHLLFRKGLASLMAARSELKVVGEASDGREALDLVRELRPDLILMDVNMPVCGGLEATKLIKAEMPAARVVMLTVSDEETDLYQAIRSGAQGYLLKNLRPDSLFEMIGDAMRGEAPLSPGVAAKILEDLGRTREREPEVAAEGLAELTQREQEILVLVVDGASNREIAVRLGITEGTVKNHLHHILEKLHLNNRVQITAYALRNNLVAERQPGTE